MRVAAIVVAAGRGERLGHALPKAFVPLRGRSLLGHAVAALAASDRVDAVLPVPPRDECFAAQTPQVFRAALLREALEKARAEGRTGTDCAQLVEALGVRVEVVLGDPDNVKITDRDDLFAAERALEARR